MMKSEKHLIFLDIDGTLVSFKGEIPQSTIQAVSQAQKNGHEVFICTGRARSCVYDFLEDFGFDGIVSGTGSHIEYKKEVVFQDEMTPRQFKRMLEVVGDCPTIVNSHSCILMRNSDVEGMCKRLMDPEETCEDFENSKFFKSLNPLVLDEDIYTYPERHAGLIAVNYVQCEKTVDQLNEEFGSEFRATMASFTEPDTHCGEVTMGKYSKGTAIEYLSKKLNVPLQNTIGIGDADNDLEMLETAGVGIAMGNATPNAKKSADYITTDIEDDGIMKALEHFGII